VWGRAVDQMETCGECDYHEVTFDGLAQDVLESTAFQDNSVGQMQVFPKSRRWER